MADLQANIAIIYCKEGLFTSNNQSKDPQKKYTFLEQASGGVDPFLMVRPFDFGFNEETGLDNEFQSKINLPEGEINRRTALKESLSTRSVAFTCDL